MKFLEIGHRTGGPVLLLLPGLRAEVCQHAGKQTSLAKGPALPPVSIN